MRSVLLVALALTAAACASTRPAAPPPPSAEDLHQTVWFDVCGDTQYWVRLRDDGLYDFTTDGPEGPWQNDGTDAWTLEGSVLSLSWSNGYRVATFDLAQETDGTIAGTTTGDFCDGDVRLQRVG